MRSDFIDGIESHSQAVTALTKAFPNSGSFSTKTLFGPDGVSPVAWLYIGEPEHPPEEDGDMTGPYLIQVDYSGKAYEFDLQAYVVKALRSILPHSGGFIRDNDGRPVS